MNIDPKTKRRGERVPLHEWKFDDVPEDELLACCYWEYARESAFIRAVVQNSKDVTNGKGSSQPLDEANRDLTSLHSIGTPAQLFLQLPFPDPWQALGVTTRKPSKGFVPRIPTPREIPPFRLGTSLDIAAQLYGIAKKDYDAGQAITSRLMQVDKGAAHLIEAGELRRNLSELETNPTPLLVHCAEGLDFFIAQINWGDFDDNQIVECFAQWVKAKGNRPSLVAQQPKGVRGMQGGPGRSPTQWRAILERLGIMRLMHHHTLDEIQELVGKVESKKSATGKLLADKDKFASKAGCMKDRAKALGDFHALFPFLSNEYPISWEPRPGGW